MRKRRQQYDTNRSMARKARLGKAWCFGCDAYMVGDGEKCPVCGFVWRKRDKKNEPPQETPND